MALSMQVRLSMQVTKQAFAISVAAALVGIVCATALYWQSGYQKSSDTSPAPDSGSIWHAVSCRAWLFLQRAQGEIPDLSWTELWKLTTSRRFGFHCMEGRSLEASLQYAAVASEGDRSEGSRIFHERCSVCHGNNGSGGPHAPPLNRTEYKHGDSDLAIYKILRDGVPGTAMPSSGLPLDKALQVVATLKTWRAHSPEEHVAKSPRLNIQVDSKHLQTAGTNPDEWLTYSGSYNGWRHTLLSEITPANAAKLRLRWGRQLDSDGAVIEATPLVIGGAIFLVESVSPVARVVALDSKTGDVIWEYKRTIPANLPLCCGRVNRGLATFGDMLFFGTADGYLVALHANDGKMVWQTLVGSSSAGYSMTGAPLVVDHSVVVGIAGGEYGVRGFLSAYDVSSGQQQWKFDTIPGPGEIGHETWENNAWRTGGGATWNTGSYDPSAGLLYWGVGNPSPPFSGDVRPGDNLFTGSVIALHASTGELAWYFQFSPHDEHDWDSTQTPVLADLLINNNPRKVICWPNRNGFYYILDRITGEFLFGVPFVEVNWATGLTPSGRPILSDVVKITTAGRHTRPDVEGGINWQNPAFDQKRGLIFIPASLGSSIFTKQPQDKVRRQADGLLVGSGWIQAEPAAHVIRALDAATGKKRWDYKPATSDLRHYSGLLSTEGGLVFGAAGGFVFAVDADTGREVWRLSLGGDTAASPISFAVDGKQVITVVAGQTMFMFGL